MDERKFISWIIVIGVPVVFLIWFFGYKGTIQFESNVPEFNIEFENGKKVHCSLPCLVRQRAGKKIRGKVSADGFLPTSFMTNPLRVLQKQIINLNFAPAPVIEKFDIRAYEILQKNTHKNFPFDWNRMFGSPLVDPDGDFAIFTEKLGSRLSLKIMDKKGEEKLLNVLRGDFDILPFRRNFSLQENGVVLPEKNNLYFYDFLTRRRMDIFSGPMDYLRNISVGDNEFVAQVGEGWYRFSKNKKTALKTGTKFASFYKNKLWEVRDDQIFINGVGIFDLPQMYQVEKIWLQRGVLFLQNDKEIWKIEFP